MDFIDYIESNFDIDRVSCGTQIKLNGECPFCHKDSSDLRLYIGIKSKLGMCLHCNTGFNAVKFVAAREGVSAAKAIRILNDDDDAYKKEGTAAEEKPEGAILFPEVKGIGTSVAASGYLNRRGLDLSLTRHFKLGFCDTNTVIDGRVFYTRNRIIIPISDMTGRIVSWQGRDITGASKLRYLFPPRFKGAEYVYNAEAIPDTPDYLIVSEGAFGAFGWWQAGYKNVVATFGKKISSAQVEILRLINPKTLFMAWDSDAADKKFEFCEKYGHIFKSIRIVDLKDKDADQLKRASLTEALEQSVFYSWDKKVLDLL